MYVFLNFDLGGCAGDWRGGGGGGELVGYGNGTRDEAKGGMVW